MGDFERAAADARLCVRCEPRWDKAHFRLLTALLAADQVVTAMLHVQQYDALLRQMPSVAAPCDSALRRYTPAFYDERCAQLTMASDRAVSVLYVDRRLGKALFLARPAELPAHALLFSEAPIASQQQLASARQSPHLTVCSHCCRVKLDARAIGAANVAALAAALPARHWTACACGSVYCSRACVDKAKQTYHAALCSNGQPGERAIRRRVFI